MAVLGSTSFLQYCISWSSLALLYYDYTLTFGMEVKYIWGAKLSLSTVAYFGCRYALVANVLFLLAMSNYLTFGCDTWYKIIDVLAVLGRASIIVTFTARTYAVYGRNRLVLIYLAALGLATVITDSIHVRSQNCNYSERTPIVSLLRSLLTIIFETSSALLITFRTARSFRAYGPCGTGRKNILFLIFEEGLAYFCLISFFTIATFILKLRAPPGPYQDILNAFTLPLSGILTARFILHLRAWRDQENVYIKTMTNRQELEPHQSHLRHLRDSYRAPFHFGATAATSLSVSSSAADDPPRQLPSPLSDTSTLVPEFGEDPEVTARRKARVVQGYWYTTDGVLPECIREPPGV